MARLGMVKFSKNLTTMGANVFENCTSLTTVDLSYCTKLVNDISKTGQQFKGCSNLKSVLLSNSLKILPASMFAGCTSLTTVTYMGTAEEWNAISKASDSIPSGVEIVYKK